MHTLLAVDIGGTKTIVGLVDEAGNILEQRRFASPGSGSEILREIIARGRELLADAGRVLACGVGFGGPVDFARQRLLTSLHVKGWAEIDLIGELQTAFAVPCVLDNDATVATLGEQHYGAGKGSSNFVYVTVSTGIGGGLVIGGQIHRGTHGLAGEVGHLCVEPGGRPCTCGRRGCVEAYSSGWALAARAHELLATGSPTLLREYEAHEISARHVFAAAERGDEPARSLVREATEYLARGLAHVVNLLDTELVVVGGGISQAGPPFFDPLNAALPAHLFYPEVRKARCVPAGLGEYSVLLGAVALALTTYRPG